jgi:ABC-type branched-subunit amino acid transport system substrate-binding protein
MNPTQFAGLNSIDALANAFTNEPTGSTVTLGFNVPQSGPYADEGADELRAYELAVEHLNGGGDGGMLNTFSSKALKATGTASSARRSSSSQATRRPSPTQPAHPQVR